MSSTTTVGFPLQSCKALIGAIGNQFETYNSCQVVSGIVLQSASIPLFINDVGGLNAQSYTEIFIF